MSNSEGDYIEGLDFTLRKIAPLPEAVSLPDSAAVSEIAEIPGLVAGTDTLKVTPPEPVRAVDRDTSYLVVHEVTRELVTITEDYFAVQFGAFRTKLYAEIMKNKVDGVLDKNVELFEEDGFWKVRITGFKDREELDKYIPVIHGQGITEIWVITNKAVKGEWITTTKEDSLAVVKETVTEEPMPVVIAGTTVQLGSFSSLEETVSMSDRLLAAAEKLVTIRNEGGLYKVQITGFADTNEVRNFLPLLRKHGFEDITVLHESETGLVPVAPAVEAPVAEEPAGIKAEAVQPAQDVQAEIIPEEPVKVEEVAPTPPPVPRFVLHAGSYYKKAEAERARQRIERRLKLPVEVLEEWDTYRVVITGFFTREETYPYYPELAGLGFTDIFVYEKPLTER
ncbi:SPOR domain-containing protein [bacterium]|nr:SPOR domain-containing protein [bacterium]